VPVGIRLRIEYSDHIDTPGSFINWMPPVGTDALVPGPALRPLCDLVTRQAPDAMMGLAGEVVNTYSNPARGLLGSSSLDSGAGT
jgi:hypothetical protein